MKLCEDWYRIRQTHCARGSVNLFISPPAETIDTIPDNPAGRGLGVEWPDFYDAFVFRDKYSKWVGLIRKGSFMLEQQRFDSKADAKAWCETVLRLL
jgi:hypothetical protein